MPPSISNQEIELRRKARRRLIGAIALVLALVVLLPMVLDHEPNPVDANIPIRLPQANAERAATEPAMPDDTARAATQTDAAGTGAAAPAPSEPAPSSETAAVGVQDKPPAATSDKPAAIAAASGEFVVQVGAFSNGEKAEQAQRKVAAAGLPVFTETVDVDGQARIRVRAGPFSERSEAEAALEKLNAAGFGGKLMMK